MLIICHCVLSHIGAGPADVARAPARCHQCRYAWARAPTSSLLKSICYGTKVARLFLGLRVCVCVYLSCVSRVNTVDLSVNMVETCCQWAPEASQARPEMFARPTPESVINFSVAKECTHRHIDEDDDDDDGK